MTDEAANMRLGRLSETSVAGETVHAFVPPALPPEPPIDVLPLLDKLSAAERALGRLDGITMLLPRHELFLYMYVRKEAVLSSQIEGTQSTLTDLLRYEATVETGQPFDDVREVSNYVDAMMFGLSRLEELPLSLRLIREMHARLMDGNRGGNKNPGEFRRSQNWIGGSRPGNAMFVPPPISELDGCLSAFEAFIHDETSGLPPLLKAGLLHVQFETIHPFLDGNGRIGRLLITLYLCSKGSLRAPLLYLSLFFKSNRTEYYRLLQNVRETGAWEDWLAFYLTGVEQTANQAFDAATRIVELFKADRDKIMGDSDRAGSSLRVHEWMQSNPFVSSNLLVERIGLSPPTVNAALADLERLGIVSEVTGKRRNRVFSYTAFLDILSEGTGPV